MNTTDLKLLTIITEPLLEQKLVDLIQASGARGHTISDCRGDGSRGIRAGDLSGKNIKIESVVSPEVAKKLMSILQKDYFPRFALIAFLTDVSVVRGEKYAG